MLAMPCPLRLCPDAIHAGRQDDHRQTSVYAYPFIPGLASPANNSIVAGNRVSPGFPKGKLWN